MNHSSEPSNKPSPENLPLDGLDKTHHRVCNYCEAMCGVSVNYIPTATTPETMFRVRPDKHDTFSKGSMCPKASALGPLYLDPNRLKYPVKKIVNDAGEIDWQQITWDEAYNTVAENVIKVRDQYGADAIATYLGNPIVHNLGMMIFVKVLTKAVGSKNIFSATSMDQLPHHFAGHFMFGHEFRIPVPDIDRTDHMIIMGANPMASNGSIMTSAGVSKRLQKIQKRGGKFIVIDPRKTETAKICSEHHFIQPATDLYFLLAFLHVLFRDKHIKLGKLANHINDFDKIEPLIGEFSPTAVAPITGIEASEIERLVSEYVNAKTAVLYGRMGLSTQPHGGLCHWLINTINIVSGNFDKPGGMMFPSPAIELARDKQHQVFGRWKSRARDLPEFGGEYPVSTMADELLTKGDHQVKAFISICGNPVLSSPGGHRLNDGLKDIDFMVSIDNYINETTRHADIILPTPSGLEIDHYDLIFNTISVTNNAKFSKAMMPVESDRPFDWQVLKELGQRIAPNGLSLFDRFSTPRRIVNLGLLFGEYGKLSSPRRWFSGLSLQKVIDSEHGVDLGAMRSRVPTGLKTADKKIHLAPSVFLERLQQVSVGEYVTLKQSAQDNQAQGNEAKKTNITKKSSTLKLIGRRNVYTNNSWMHQVPNLNKSKQVRCTAMISPTDATRLQLDNGETVKIRSRVGEVLIPIEITDTIMPGVVSIPHGFGHTKKGTRIPVAEQKPGVSVNDLTDPMRIDPLTGNAAFSGLELELTKIAEHKASELSSGKPLTILYGSQSGNSEMIALDASKLAKEHELLPYVASMADITVDELKKTERLLLIVSTFGEGDMPDAAEPLWTALAEADNTLLSQTHYAVLALGDSSYEHFCQAGVNWDNRLAELGAMRLQDVVKSDVDYTDVSDSWLRATLPDLSIKGDQTIVKQTADVLPANSSAKSTKTTRFNRANPMPLTLLSKRNLNSSASSKQTMHYELSFEQAKLNYQTEIKYQAGDALYVIPKNDSTLANHWLDYLELDADADLEGFDTTAGDVFRRQLEIRLPSRNALEFIAKHSPELRSLLDSDTDIESQFWGKDTLDIAKEYQLPQKVRAEFVATLPPIAPRAYSISSSPSATPSVVTMTIATVRYGDDKIGTASGYLADELEIGESIDGYFVANKHFSIPSDGDTPIIMIGPGTGIAPFRSFLLERQQRGHHGENWLFFGDRNAESDFLYQDELNVLIDKNVLTRLDLAFSRDQQHKIYVQDRMREHGAELYQWLQRGAYVYVCGDAKQMAVSVHQALLDIIAEHGALTSDQARDFLDTLTNEKRYLKDVY